MNKRHIGYLMMLGLSIALIVFEGKTIGSETGPIWTFDTGGPVRSTPVVSGSSLLVGSDSGMLFSIDTDSGLERWRFRADSAVASDPCLEGDAVYFATKKGSLYSLDSETAKVNWRFSSPAESLYEGGWDYFVSSPVVSGEAVICGYGDNRIRALSTKTGMEIWAFDTGSMVRSTPAVSKNSIFCGTMEGEMFALDIETGKQIWKFKATGNKNFPKGEILFQPVVHRGAVCFGSRDAVFYALEAETGSLIWKVDATGPWYTKSAALDDTIFAASSDGHFVQALDIGTGEEKWKFLAEDLIFSRPAAAGGILYFGSHDSNLYAVDVQDGKLLKRYHTEDAVLSSPVIDRGVLYIGSDDGRLYAFRCPPPPPGIDTKGHRAVYWDPDLDSKVNRYLSIEEQKVLLFLKEKGYELLDASKLVGFMQARISGGTPGVIVLLSVHMPYALFEASEGQTPLLRGYLDARNSIVSIQSSSYLVSSKDTEDNIFIPKELPGIFGLSLEAVRHAFFSYDSYISRPTKEGKAMGLPSWWNSGYGIDPGAVDTVLGLDEHGRATSWMKNYGGPQGTGLIRIWGGQNFPEDLSFITRAADNSIQARTDGNRKGLN